MSSNDALDPAVPAVVVADECPILWQLLGEWPTAAVLREEMHQRDLERAAQPPVINVTLTDVPGHYEIATGPNPVITYHDESAPELHDTLVLTAGAQQLRMTPPDGVPQLIP